MNPAADLALFYAAWPATDVMFTPAAGGASKAGRAIFDQPGITVLGGEVLATDFTLQYPLTAFPGVKKGDRFQVCGVTYTVREFPQPTQDGLEVTVPLSKG